MEFNISYKFSSVAKQRDPNTIIVWGGPNFPTEENEKRIFKNGLSLIFI